MAQVLEAMEKPRREDEFKMQRAIAHAVIMALFILLVVILVLMWKGAGDAQVLDPIPYPPTHTGDPIVNYRNMENYRREVNRINQRNLERVKRRINSGELELPRSTPQKTRQPTPLIEFKRY